LDFTLPQSKISSSTLFTINDNNDNLINFSQTHSLSINNEECFVDEYMTFESNEDETETEYNKSNYVSKKL
jgi:hypothetical protein